MAISFNHTIVAARDKQKSAEFLADLFGLPSPKPFGHFMVVALEHGVNLDFADAPEGEEIRRQHYAFLVSEEDFDAIYGKIQARGLQHWADPGQRRPGEINEKHGGRGVYFPDPAGHAMEILTRPYGSA
ncbi:Catechol 2,3-dioxygenase or other lactoylglutathione lyase family enzyme [Mycobacterium rhizamassiliense]|uniref:Catechol 2,3-dioxygenase or other lactoylglutathione lyase family enzyme n=1 Tax=Mycobacterium rhizamassiliense TaxID=1841860 RepID=A0A2U3NVT1_9MYCO|nr:VOC family protein [Mycobacterium rhizamassiliense]SPM35598.1 Catechol 2,3-dioxygenase or other lactoylglutathione lyase family enzyme [Mycobacterium rhizamassiliense]